MKWAIYRANRSRVEKVALPWLLARELAVYLLYGRILLSIKLLGSLFVDFVGLLSV